jgi:hypothetical protein
VIPLVGLTAAEREQLEARSPADGSFDVVQASVAKADLDALLDRIRVADIDGVGQPRAAITKSYLADANLPVGASTSPDDYVVIESATVSEHPGFCQATG